MRQIQFPYLKSFHIIRKKTRYIRGIIRISVNKTCRGSWFDDQFYTSYFIWDSFTPGVASLTVRNLHNNKGENECAEMEYIKPCGKSNGINPFFDGRATPRFNLIPDGVHSEHVQTGVHDPFCFVQNGKGRYEDGYTKEVVGQE